MPHAPDTVESPSPSPRRHAPATTRNREAIAAVLARVLPASGLVLEVAAGSGEHAAHFAPLFPHLRWQPTDHDPGALASIAAWAEDVAEPARPLPPLVLDAAAADWPVTRAEAVVCINMIHIAPWEACLGLLAGAGRVLPPGGVLYLYGPYRIDGAHTAPSNAQFEAWLTAQDPRYGVRDRDAVATAAAAHGLFLSETIAMPANNLSLVFLKPAD